jgi:hypothetical protein
MRQLFPFFLLVSVSLISCQDSPTALENTATNKVVSSTPEGEETVVEQTADTPSESEAYPEIGIPIELIQGGLLCYATIIDQQGQQQEIGATFDICQDQEAILNQRVRLIYTTENVADCESAEPCGKTRQATVISNTVLPGENTERLTNDQWTIFIGNGESWDGTNNTGNLTYYGCDSNNNCLALTGGKVTCRNGVCNTGWANGDYTYIISQTITENSQDSTTTLTVRQGSEVIVESDGFISTFL